MEVIGQLYTLTTFPTWDDPLLFIGREDGWLPGPVWTFREERNFLHLPEIEPRPSRSLITILTELSRIRIVVHQGLTNFSKI
jgi:hypothetical protein